MDMVLNTVLKVTSLTRGTFETTNTMAGEKHPAILDNLEKDFMMATVFTRSTVSTTKGFFKKHNLMVKELVFKEKIWKNLLISKTSIVF